MKVGRLSQYYLLGLSFLLRIIFDLCFAALGNYKDAIDE